jgi:sec-independent protein translocase protein TatC
MPKAELSDKIMPFGDHLEELRKRLILALLGLAPILIISLVFGKAILGFLMEPIYAALAAGDQATNLQTTNFFEIFSAYMKISLVMSVLVGAPWIVYQAWRFIAPGLYAHERRFAHLLAPMSVVLTVLSAVFLYYVMLPTVLTFFVMFNASVPTQLVQTSPLAEGVSLQMATVLDADPVDPPVGAIWYNRTINQLRVCVPDKHGVKVVKGSVMVGSAMISQQYKVADCVGMVLTFALALAIAFQMPVVVLLLGWAGIVTPAWLAGYRRYVMMICAGLGALLTPGADPVSMVLLAVPLYLLFELGVFLLRVLPASRVAGDKPAGAAGSAVRGEHDTGDTDPFAKPDDQ